MRGHALTPLERLHRMTTEDALQAKVTELAIRRGWWIHHTRPVWTKKGFRSPLGGMKGFPDWVLARMRPGGLALLPPPNDPSMPIVMSSSSQVLIVELKQELATLEPEQEEWRRRLEPSGLYRLWRPSSWLEIERELM